MKEIRRNVTEAELTYHHKVICCAFIEVMERIHFPGTPEESVDIYIPHEDVLIKNISMKTDDGIDYPDYDGFRLKYTDYDSDSKPVRPYVLWFTGDLHLLESWD